MKTNDSGEMFVYYDKRAAEYDDIYQGKAPGIPEPKVYKEDVEKIVKIAAHFGRGHLIDIGCGTGYWLPHYSRNCSEITLVDQSRRMLVECQKRVNTLHFDMDVHYIEGNFLEVDFSSGVFDSAVVAFLVSHLTKDISELFFDKLRKILKPGANVLWIDGSWSHIRKRHRIKSGPQKRALKNGQAFTIFKRYFDKHDIESAVEENSLVLDSIYFGDVFFAAQASLRN